MELSKFTQSETVTFFIVDPITLEDTDIEVTVYNADTTHAKKAISKVNAMECPEEQRDIALIGAMIKSWKNVEYEGKSIELSLDNCVQLFSDVPVMANQIQLKAFNRVNFMKG